MANTPAGPPKPDLNHLEWQVDRRSEIQRTLFALYRLVRDYKDQGSDPDPTKNIIDDLVSAAFSLWRAVFLAETDRDWLVILKSEERFSC